MSGHDHEHDAGGACVTAPTAPTKSGKADRGVCEAVRRGNAVVDWTRAISAAVDGASRTNGSSPPTAAVAMFHAAVAVGRVDAVADILQRVPALHPETPCPNCGRPPLHAAVTHLPENPLAMLHVLSAAGASINAQSPTFRQETAVHAAAAAGSRLALCYLVERGADVNAADSDGQTPIFHAIKAGHGGMVEGLLGLGADAAHLDASGNSTLHVAILERRIFLAMRLVQKGASPDQPNAAGETARGLAAASGQGILIRTMDGDFNTGSADAKRIRQGGALLAVVMLWAATMRRLRYVAPAAALLLAIGAVSLRPSWGWVAAVVAIFFGQMQYRTLPQNGYGQQIFFFSALAVSFGNFFLVMSPSLPAPMVNTGLCLVTVGLPTWVWLVVGDPGHLERTGGNGIVEYAAAVAALAARDPKAVAPPTAAERRAARRSAGFVPRADASPTMFAVGQWMAFCTTCSIARPNRSKHCGQCGDVREGGSIAWY